MGVEKQRGGRGVVEEDLQDLLLLFSMEHPQDWWVVVRGFDRSRFFRGADWSHGDLFLRAGEPPCSLLFLEFLDDGWNLSHWLSRSDEDVWNPIRRLKGGPAASRGQDIGMIFHLPF